jgi:methylated-DNA-protein-cysteine methyltransferase related protein
MNGHQVPMSHLYEHIYALVSLIPRGHVATYGQLAQLVGTTPRVIGFALAALPNGSEVPWQRVISSTGKVSQRHDGDGALLQRQLLQQEGVHFSGDGCDLRLYRFDFGGDHPL